LPPKTTTKNKLIQQNTLHSIFSNNENGNNNNDNDDNTIKARKIEEITAGLYKSIQRDLNENVSAENALAIAEYILAMKTETNLADTSRTNIIKTLSLISRFHKNKSFRNMTREDVLQYLDSMRKSEEHDSLHKWIGSYNLRRIILLKFFKWFYSPKDRPEDRKVPPVMENVLMLKRKEQSIYRPTDLWTVEDDLSFLKYCPSKRDRCYHTIARDTSCRPHEILKLRIRDIVFKTTGNYQYAEVMVNGKTGSRSIPLFDSIPYLKDWLDDNIQRGNPNAFLIPSRNRSRFGRKMTGVGINFLYRNYKTQFFPKLLEDPNVPTKDKQKIRELLKKPWNPYIRRHSALTEKSMILKEHVLRQHAGWSGSSQMPQKYLHYFGNESSESLLEAYGIVTKDSQLADQKLRPKLCPNCSEPNKPDSKFCAKCRMVLTYDAYNEKLDEKSEQTNELTELKKRQEQFEQLIQSLIDSGQLRPTVNSIR
jgi:integrase/recombinase XerD